MTKTFEAPIHQINLVASSLAISFSLGCSVQRAPRAIPINPIIGKPEIYSNALSPLNESNNFISICLTTGFDNKHAIIYLDNIRVFDDVIKINQFSMHSIYNNKILTYSHSIMIYIPERNEHYIFSVDLRNGKWFYLSFRDTKIYLEQLGSPIAFM